MLKIFIIIIACIFFVVFYLCAGYCIAWMRTRTKMARRAALIHNREYPYRVQLSIKQQFYYMIVAWPVYFPVSLVFSFCYLFMTSPDEDFTDGALHTAVAHFRSHVDNMIERSA